MWTTTHLKRLHWWQQRTVSLQKQPFLRRALLLLLLLLLLAGCTIAAIRGADDFGKLGLVVQAFLSRTVDVLEAKAPGVKSAKELKRVTVEAKPSDLSAGKIAATLAPPKSCDAVAAYAAAGMANLPFVQQLDQSLLNRMHTETVEAKVQSKQSYLFVDLTSKEVLPLWVFREAVGCRTDDHCLEQ